MQKRNLLLSLLLIAAFTPIGSAADPQLTLEEQGEILEEKIRLGTVSQEDTFCLSSDVIPCAFVCWPVDGFIVLFAGRDGGVRATCDDEAKCGTTNGQCNALGKSNNLRVSFCMPEKINQVGTILCGSPMCNTTCEGERQFKITAKSLRLN
jgi:hypothetical protein